MGLERPRRGAARNRLHHRRLDLEETQRVEERAQVPDDRRAHPEHPPAVLVHDQIDVAATVAKLGIGDAMPLVRQRTQRLGEQHDALGAHRELARPGAEQHALGAEDVAHVPGLEVLVGRRRARRAAGRSGSRRSSPRASRSSPFPSLASRASAPPRSRGSARRPATRRTSPRRQSPDRPPRRCGENRSERRARARAASRALRAAPRSDDCRRRRS